MGVSLSNYRVGGVRVDGVRVDGVYFYSAVAPTARSNEPMLLRSRPEQRVARDSSRLLGDGDAVDPLNRASLIPASLNYLNTLGCMQSV